MSKIEELFGRHRVSAHIAFQQLITAVQLAGQGNHRPVTKNLYPEVARRCKSKPHRVEKNIRAMRDKLWSDDLRRCRLCEACGCYGIPEERPKTAEFVEMLVRYAQAKSKVTA